MWCDDPPAAAQSCTARASSGRSPWSSPPETLGAGAGAGSDVAKPYDIVAGAFAGALEALGVDAGRRPRVPYQRSALCFASVLRHDLLAAARSSSPSPRRGAAAGRSCTGPCSSAALPRCSTQVVETLLGEPWQGDGLAGAG